MESAVGFYANKPPRCLLQARSGPRSALWKQETTQVGGKLPGDERAGGGSCLYHVSSLRLTEMWLACDAAIYYLWWWIAPPLSPVRSRWRWLSARWRWARRGGCQVRASGWRRLAMGGWGADCGQRRSPRCPAGGRSAAGARAGPPALEGRRSLTLGWREEKERQTFIYQIHLLEASSLALKPSPPWFYGSRRDNLD